MTIIFGIGELKIHTTLVNIARFDVGPD
jgi:hypothetical protein